MTQTPFNSIFTHVLYVDYGSPVGFNFDINYSSDE